MANNKYRYWHTALVTLEAKSVHGVATGHAGTRYDVTLQRDAWGLPALPATSLAGVMRSLYQAQHGEREADSLFGSHKGGVSQSSERSRVTFSWGLTHDSNDHPVEARPENLESDPVLKLLTSENPILRDRVRLNELGAAADTAKFDTTRAPAGTRYSFLIDLHSDEQNPQEWTQLLALLHSPLFRIGAGTRTGAGAFKIAGLHVEITDKKDPEYVQAHRRNRQKPKGPYQAPELPNTEQLPVESFTLEAESSWFVGGGVAKNDSHNKECQVQQVYREKRIEWKAGTASINEREVLPATAIKGALRHRAAFYLRCAEGVFADPDNGFIPKADAGMKGLDTLMGCVGEQDQRAGCVYIDDIYYQPGSWRQTHNKIDRFTGGTIDGALFSYDRQWQNQLDVNLVITPLPDSSPAGDKQDWEKAKKALDRAIEDLKSGLLPLGQGGSRGQGAFLEVKESEQSKTEQGVA